MFERTNQTFPEASMSMCYACSAKSTCNDSNPTCFIMTVPVDNNDTEVIDIGELADEMEWDELEIAC